MFKKFTKPAEPEEKVVEEPLPFEYQFTHFDSWRMEKLKRYLGWQLPERELNAQLQITSSDEYDSLQSVLETEVFKENDAAYRVADFSCGIGRSSVYFKNRFDLVNTKFCMFDGEYRIYGPKQQMNDYQTNFHQDVEPIFSKTMSFYNDLDLLDCFLMSNNVTNFNIFNLVNFKDMDYFDSMEPVDLFYSFHAIGYHWEISSVFDYYGLERIFRPGTTLVFELRKETDPHGFGNMQLDLVPKLLSRGYKQVDLIEGNQIQRFLVLQKV